jgi:hypothetical protein
MTIDLADLIAATPPGMAHATGTGPADTTCRTCAFWAGNRTPIVPGDTTLLVADYSRRRWERLHGDQLVPLPQACWRYRQLKRGQLDSDDRSRRVPPGQPSCSHYLEYEGDVQAASKTIKL